MCELLSKARHYHAAGFEERSDEEYARLIELEHLIELMLKPSDRQPFAPGEPLFEAVKSAMFRLERMS